jgi:uncharacterized membrane protein
MLGLAALLGMGIIIMQALLQTMPGLVKLMVGIALAFCAIICLVEAWLRQRDPHGLPEKLLLSGLAALCGYGIYLLASG